MKTLLVLNFFLFINCFSQNAAKPQLKELNDLFPLAIGNQFIYNYKFTSETHFFFLLEHAQSDSGTISYTITDSVISENKIEWKVEQNIDVLRHDFSRLITDTTFWVSEKINYILTESLDGYHQLTSDLPFSGWGKILPWNFPTWDDFPFTTLPVAIYRYADTALIKINTSAGRDSLWFSVNKGLYKRTFNYTMHTTRNFYTNTDINLDKLIVGTDNIITNPSRNVYLFQNYPNPFNPGTTIEYSIPLRTNVIIKIYDLLGREAATLVNEEKAAGNYRAEFDGSNLPSGIYFYRLETGRFSETKKMILIK